MTADPPLPVIIIGAGISGLLLAQALQRHAIPVRVFERDVDLTTRGVGWGLTLHWSLPALRTLLPEHLVQRLPETYVDRAAVAAGTSSRFPFYDLSTGERYSQTPPATEAQRVRVTREAFRSLLATGIDIQWGKAFRNFESRHGSVNVTFEDGSSCEGRLLVGCDGTHSRVRRAMFPNDQPTYRLPIRVLGMKVSYSSEQIAPIRDLDPFFFQGTSSENDSFLYMSLLNAPGENGTSPDEYSYQLCVSWPYRENFFNSHSPIEFPGTNDARRELIQELALTWAEPFRSIAANIPESTDIKPVDLHDYPPQKGTRSAGRVVLMGDAFHSMVMCELEHNALRNRLTIIDRGEGANHAIVDVLDFCERLFPILSKKEEDWGILRSTMSVYEDAVGARTRPAVLASRQACMDAHDWGRISDKSPLLTRRAMMLDFPEE